MYNMRLNLFVLMIFVAGFGITSHPVFLMFSLMFLPIVIGHMLYTALSAKDE